MNNLTHIDCLWYYDGPLLSEFKDYEGLPVVVYWVDQGEELNTWLSFWPEPEIFAQFKGGETDFRDCMLSSKKFVLHDQSR